MNYMELKIYLLKIFYKVLSEFESVNKFIEVKRMFEASVGLSLASMLIVMVVMLVAVRRPLTVRPFAARKVDMKFVAVVAAAVKFCKVLVKMVVMAVRTALQPGVCPQALADVVAVRWCLWLHEWIVQLMP